ncbi:peptidase S8/S53 domain-containing protein [Microdochium trichocladiopsis]|uniref:Peptidase S8/S53 domain-containing protein n=1 Tax=Microdochium trichocladiopsis TaxID=1682393 RepID=A0A9P8XWY6_9PEZI|nr:peptidase S8/S53 domain-containing protein [Microdochium trichocladiopsis]KAH7017968.1 peptidase S8/S53 domain-containing protein [Microdochium trichocladiopsis]
MRLPEVSRVWPVVTISRPSPVSLVDLTEFDGSVGSPGEGYSTDIVRDKDYKIDDNLKMAGVDRLHALGVKGKGVKIAIIDSGVDYNHPGLGGGFGPGKKVAFGRNYVLDDGQGGLDDPIATCSSGGHGSHVAGIIAGEDPDDFGFGMLGVAPEATLGMYRIFACNGVASSDVVMQAMMDAYNDGVDIVSMSLGSDSGFEDADPFGQIITNAKSRGIATIIAAGNRGNLGPMLTSSPAIAPDAVAVASLDGAKYPTTYKMQGTSSTGNGSSEWRYGSLWPLDGEFPVYASADYDESTGCEYASIQKAAQAVGVNVSSTLYMVRKTYLCDLSLPLTNARSLGFKGVVVWRDQELRNPADNDYQSSGPGDFIILSMDHVDGPKLYAAVTAAGPIFYSAQFSDRRFLSVDNPSAGFTSNYSTMGNTWEFSVFKPTISAPGHLILSAWPLSVGGYAIISGTSMATPFVSGCYALLKSAYPNLSVDEMTNLFTTTAQPSKWWGDDRITHSVAHQGAGSINVWNAYNSRGTKFDQSVVLVGQGAQPVTKNITFTNTDLEGNSKTFEISHVPAGLMQRTPYADLNVVGNMVYGFPSKPIYATVDFETPTQIVLAPGESATVSFVVTPPSGLDPDTVPIYSGYIRLVVSGGGGDVYTLPYQGLTYVVNEVPVLERALIDDNPQLPAMGHLSSGGGAIEYNTEDVVTYNTTAGEYVTMTYFARQPTYVYRVDLVAANITFEPTYYGFNASHDFETTTPILPIDNTFGGVESFGLLFGSYYMDPTFHILSWWGGLVDSDNNDYLVPPGDFRLLLRLLPVSRDYDNPKDWTSWLGPVLRITGP